MQLYGTVTSPFVRRVRVVLRELGIPFTLIDTAEAPGQAALRKLNPLWKVPTLVSADRVLFDSHLIIEDLFARHGQGALRLAAPEQRGRQKQLIAAIDGALESAINVFYLRREGVDVAAIPYCQKQ